MSAPEKILLEIDADGDIEGFYTDFCADHPSETGIFYVREDLTGWRPIEDRPKEQQEVLFLIGTYYEVGYRLGDVYLDYNYHSSITVTPQTLWMPIPEPPRAES